MYACAHVCTGCVDAMRRRHTPDSLTSKPKLLVSTTLPHSARAWRSLAELAQLLLRLPPALMRSLQSQRLQHARLGAESSRLSC